MPLDGRPPSAGPPAAAPAASPHGATPRNRARRIDDTAGVCIDAFASVPADAPAADPCRFGKHTVQGAHARVVPGCHEVAAHLARPVEQRAELEVAVAVDARVGGAPLLIGADELVDDRTRERLAEVDGLPGDAQPRADGLGVLQVGQRAAGTLGVVAEGAAAREAHGRPDAFVSLLLEHVGGDA